MVSSFLFPTLASRLFARVSVHGFFQSMFVVIDGLLSGAIPYPKLLAYAQSLSALTSAPPKFPDLSLPSQPAPSLFFPLFPNEEKMCWPIALTPAPSLAPPLLAFMCASLPLALPKSKSESPHVSQSHATLSITSFL